MSIQIVVPVYNAFEVTAQALQALKKHNLQDDVLILDDASSDPRMTALYLDLPESWQLRVNPQNLGFVKTANIGLKHNPGHSLLLNSDTIVSVGWLDRFKDALLAVDAVGTATPWSNNAEICSLPETLKVNPMPEDIDLLAAELVDCHQPVYPQLPTAVGFAMLISKQAKAQVGYFDEPTFGHGYGEENDYSLRVTSAGLKNILVDHAYVAHVGNQSFQALNLKPNEQTMHRLLNKHPDYLTLIQNFIEKDPLCPIRESIIAKISSF